MRRADKSQGQQVGSFQQSKKSLKKKTVKKEIISSLRTKNPIFYENEQSLNKIQPQTPRKKIHSQVPNQHHEVRSIANKNSLNQL